MKRPSDRVILAYSIGTSAFLLFMYLDFAWLKVDLVLMGVIRELFTIPCLIAQPILWLVAFRAFYSSRFKVGYASFFALLITSATLTLTSISFL